MRIPRIYCPHKLNVGKELKLDANASRHLLHVLRLKIEDEITLFNGLGGEYEADLTAVSRDYAIVAIKEFREVSCEPSTKICLAQGIARGEKMDYIIQKAVELGVHKIVPLFTSRCNVKLNRERAEKRQHHWQKIAISACEQSGRNLIPHIHLPCAFNSWLEESLDGLGIVLHPLAQHKLAKSLNNSKKVTILVGPEGGFSSEELELVEKQGYVAVQLGKRILRSETAAMAAVSAIHALRGDF